jgi:hypothetical protein
VGVARGVVASRHDDDDHDHHDHDDIDDIDDDHHDDVHHDDDRGGWHNHDLDDDVDHGHHFDDDVDHDDVNDDHHGGGAVPVVAWAGVAVWVRHAGLRSTATAMRPLCGAAQLDRPDGDCVRVGPVRCTDLHRGAV